ncbi:MAG: hypothetical protein U0Q18_18220 [Bryobacteraceae bacterium]
MLVTADRSRSFEGVFLAETVRAEYPKTNMVFMAIENADLPHPAVRKPFEPEDLLASMTEALLPRLN